MTTKTVESYGRWSRMGWGIVELDDTDYRYLDFKPEFLYPDDLDTYIDNKEFILALPKMTEEKYLSYLKDGMSRFPKKVIENVERSVLCPVVINKNTTYFDQATKLKMLEECEKWDSEETDDGDKGSW